MPEIAEVKTITEQLKKSFEGKLLNNIEVIGGRFTKNNKLKDKLAKLKLPLVNTEINCKGKFLYWQFDQINFAITLGMTGSFTKDLQKHSALKFTFENEVIYFTDIRHFGTFDLIDSIDLAAKLNSLGWDPLRSPLNKNIKDSILVSLSKKQEKTIAEVLLDQSIFCGLGNYLRSEILYDCQIDPNRLIKNMHISEVEKIILSFEKISKLSYSLRGATLATYKDANGDNGDFAKMLKVYGKTQDPLGNMVRKLRAKDGRTVHYVKEVQK